MSYCVSFRLAAHSLPAPTPRCCSVIATKTHVEYNMVPKMFFIAAVVTLGVALGTAQPSSKGEYG